jgi:hypothetical protein
VRDEARNLALPVAAALAALLLWDSAVVYPIKIFVVFLHELSHGMAAVASGGSIVRIEPTPDQAGLCVHRGGWRFLTLSAGYLGSLLWGALLLVLGARTRLDRPIVGGLGLLTLAVTLLYVRTGFGLGYGVLAGSALLATASTLPAAVSDAVLKVVGTVSCLYAVRDIAEDALLRDIPGSDANALGALTGLPGAAWGVAWILVSLAVTAGALKLAAGGATKAR